MERELQKGPKVSKAETIPARPTRRKQSKNLPHIDIYCISLVGFH
jgi:hypothetical protein